jgi:3-hydroxymyristoyl/3-hydroxydecanoyl-(acyl carrier protein) dehydratase
MCCIDHLTAFTETGGEAAVLLRPGHILLNADGRMDPCGFIELAAQTAGAMAGAQAETAMGGSPPDSAMLVGVQKFFARGRALCGDRLRVEVAVLARLEDMLSLRFTVRKDRPEGSENTPLADGRLSAFVSGTGDGRMKIGTSGHPALRGRSGRDAAPTVPVSTTLPEAVGLSASAPPRVDGEEGGATTALFTFSPDFPGFDGHFPGNPVVPGIALLMAAARTVSPAVPAEVAEIVRCKFFRPVLPGETVRIRAAASGSGGKVLWRARLDVDGEPCAEAAFVPVPRSSKIPLWSETSP